jgi:hypothetical protein
MEQLDILGLPVSIILDHDTPGEQLSGTIKELSGFHWLSWIVLQPLIASIATLALNLGLWVRRLLIGRCPGSGVNPGQLRCVGVRAGEQPGQAGGFSAPPA